MSGPLARRTRAVQTNLTNDEAIGRLSLLILVAYLLATLVPLVRWGVAGGSWVAVIAHFAALVLVASAARGRGTRAVRDWIPLALGPFLYVELRWIIEAVGQSHADALVAGWESALFPFDPSASLARLWPSGALSELLHLCYLSYYALVYVPPALLWLRGARQAFAATVLALVVVYAMCFVAYAIVPVDGPRFMHGPSMAPSGPIRAIVVRLLESGSSRGTAFPSSHVAASVVAALCALRDQKRVGVVVAVLAAGLALGAVYGGYHYAVDVLAGVATGLLAFAGARVMGQHRSKVLDPSNL
ncbi:MAG: phosphatase PAP2 family protein [bacterium]